MADDDDRPDPPGVEAARRLLEADAAFLAATSAEGRRDAVVAGLAAGLDHLTDQFGVVTPFVLRRLLAGLADLQAGRTPDWLERAATRGGAPVPTLDAVNRAAVAGTIDFLIRRGLRAEAARRRVADELGMPELRLRDWRARLHRQDSAGLGATKVAAAIAADLTRQTQGLPPALAIERACEALRRWPGWGKS